MPGRISLRRQNSAGCNRVVIIEQINFPAGGLAQDFGQQNKMAEAIVPIADAFRAIAVRREAGEKIADAMLAGGGKERAVVARIGSAPARRKRCCPRRRRSSSSARASRKSPSAGLRSSRETAPSTRRLHVVADEFARGGRKFVAEHKIRLGQFGGQAGCAEIGLISSPRKFFRLAVVRRHTPRFVRRIARRWFFPARAGNGLYFPTPRPG